MQSIPPTTADKQTQAQKRRFIYYYPGMPRFWFWLGSGLVLRCLGPGFTVLALGPGFRPIIIIINAKMVVHLVKLVAQNYYGSTEFLH